MEAKMEELLVQLARENAAIESHMRAYPDAYKDDKSHIDRMRLIDYREETLREISRYATRFAAATGKL